MLRRLHASAAFHARHWVLERRPECPVVLPEGRAVVSFTFDDFPASALETGGALLERHGLRGTFYWAGGLVRDQHPDAAGLAAAHLQQAHQLGHELGCHTFRHLDCISTTSPALQADLDRNQAEAKAAAPELPPFRHFAYPYGRVSRAARSLVSKRFLTGRGVHHGINRGVVDAALLRANPLYGAAAHYRRAMVLIDEVRRRGGWLIFFTHDVSDQPGAYGAATVALEHIIAAVAQSGCDVLPIGAAAKELGLTS